jgi:hypothetical protein
LIIAGPDDAVIFASWPSGSCRAVAPVTEGTAEDERADPPMPMVPEGAGMAPEDIDELPRGMVMSMFSSAATSLR